MFIQEWTFSHLLTQVHSVKLSLRYCCFQHFLPFKKDGYIDWIFSISTTNDQYFNAVLSDVTAAVLLHTI